MQLSIRSFKRVLMEGQNFSLTALAFLIVRLSANHLLPVAPFRDLAQPRLTLTYPPVEERAGP